MTIRNQWVYLVVTILRTKNSYRLKMFEPKLKTNEFCYRIKVSVDEQEWFKRIEELDVGKISPPELSKLDNMQVIMAPATSAVVLNRLAGRESPDQILKEIKIRRAHE